MFKEKTIDEIEKMSSEEVRAEMLEIWHDLDFNNMTKEESEKAIEQLRLYKEVCSRRQYEYRYY